MPASGVAQRPEPIHPAQWAWWKCQRGALCASVREWLAAISKHSFICATALKERLRSVTPRTPAPGFGQAQLAGDQAREQGVAQGGEGLGLQFAFDPIEQTQAQVEVWRSPARRHCRADRAPGDPGRCARRPSTGRTPSPARTESCPPSCVTAGRPNPWASKNGGGHCWQSVDVAAIQSSDSSVGAHSSQPENQATKEPSIRWRPVWVSPCCHATRREGVPMKTA